MPTLSRPLKIADYGELFSTPCQFTRADYTAAGLTDPAEGDIVTMSATGNFFVKMLPDNQTGRFGRVTRLEETGASGATGKCVVEWFDVVAAVKMNVLNLANVTLGNSMIKNGNTTVPEDWDALATTGSVIAWAKSGTSGAGTVLGMVCVQ